MPLAPSPCRSVSPNGFIFLATSNHTSSLASYAAVVSGLCITRFPRLASSVIALSRLRLELELDSLKIFGPTLCIALLALAELPNETPESCDSP